MNSQSVFDAAYDAHAPRVYAYFTLCLGADAAADLTQQTFMQLWAHLRREPPPDNLRAWVFRIAVNVKNDWLRRKQRTPALVSLDDRQRAAPDDELVTALAVRTAFARLSAAQRDVLLLKQMGLTSDEIGRAIHLSASAVRSRMAAAKKQFRRELEDCGVTMDEDDG
ncbi:MAG: RNA polymerase sigma factor [Eubacteriales bacterium]|nr:RNA polymerase sigma factor [Eubacteriales bacterium]